MFCEVHSLGGLIARAALPLLKQYRQQFQSFICLYVLSIHPIQIFEEISDGRFFAVFLALNIFCVKIQ